MTGEAMIAVTNNKMYTCVHVYPFVCILFHLE